MADEDQEQEQEEEEGGGKSRLSRFRKRKSRFGRKAQEEESPETGFDAPSDEGTSDDFLGSDSDFSDMSEMEGFDGFESQEEAHPYIPVTNALTIDVKEWFQTAALSDTIKMSHWNKYERRVEHGIQIILALLRQYDIKATFFVLGVIAREFPELVRQIAEEGHEIGTMGYYNRILHTITPNEYIKELDMSLSLLRSLSGQEIKIHRAPELSVTAHTLWVMDILRSYGITCDSSIYPVNGMHYGVENAPRFPFVLAPYGLTEFPLSTYKIMGKNVALFGGTNLRVLPYGLVSMGAETINREGHPIMIHVSPWEIDGEFPKMELDWNGYLAQYAGVKSTFTRLNKLLSEFRFDTISRVMEETPPENTFHYATFIRSKKGGLFSQPMT